MIKYHKIFIRIKCNFYKVLNFRKPKILVFTDSRGFEITKPLNRKNPFSSYVGCLIRRYNVDYQICPEKSTTIVDFLYYYSTVEHKKYDYVILHAGLVDFSPRPISMVEKIIEEKCHKFEFLSFKLDKLRNYHKNNEFIECYYGESLSNLYSREALTNLIIPKLREINGLVYIGCNKVLPDWHGSYWKNRPQEINVILEYSEMVMDSISSGKVDISNWSESDIKRCTSDNIHPNENGFAVIVERLKDILVK